MHYVLLVRCETEIFGKITIGKLLAGWDGLYYDFFITEVSIKNNINNL